MSEIEEIIERIKNHKGSERYIILGKGNEVLRSHPVSEDSDVARVANTTTTTHAKKTRHDRADEEPNTIL